jgi:CheY-like chemotaxis protein
MPQPSSTARHGTERILVVEDTDIVRPLLLRMLESYGYDVVGASNAEEALVLCTSGHFELIVTDSLFPAETDPHSLAPPPKPTPGSASSSYPAIGQP